MFEGNRGMTPLKILFLNPPSFENFDGGAIFAPSRPPRRQPAARAGC
jgi:hypothetical protein